MPLAERTRPERVYSLDSLLYPNSPIKSKTTLRKEIDNGNLHVVRLSPRRIGVTESEHARWLSANSTKENLA